MTTCQNCHRRLRAGLEAECLVCSRAGCSKCFVFVGAVRPVEWREPTTGWTSTGAAGFAGVWGTGIIVKGGLKEGRWISAQAKRWACSWACFDRWASETQGSEGPPSDRDGTVLLGGILLASEPARRLQAAATPATSELIR